MRLLLFCDSHVGSAIFHHLLQEYPEDLGAVVTTRKNSIFESAFQHDIPAFVFESEEQFTSAISTNSRFDLGLLAWWPKIISAQIISLTKGGFINTHPSLLPYNRGKHYNFWALVEQAPFGVTLHYVNDNIDAGDIVAQNSISYGWEDTGETLYKQASQAMINLFIDSYPMIRAGKVLRVAQDLTRGSFHYGKEIDEASRIDLDNIYTARKLLNLLRARTFPGHPACEFIENGLAYEVTVKIKRKIK
jgi:methionyl-tRNA formyltransferase